MASLLSILLLLTFSSSFLCSSSQISRKELRDDDFKQEMVIQFRSSVHSDRIDPSRVVQLSWRPRVFLYEGFLSDEECDHLISLDDVVSRIEERISAWTFLPKENGKALQILRCENEDSRMKLDYFGNSSLPDQSKPLIATVVLYLSDVNNGGQIIFPKSEVKGNIWSDCTKNSSSRDILKPIKGNAVLFFNIYPNSTTDGSSSHARCPVLEGEMWFAIKFFQVKFIAEEKLSSELGDEDCTDEDDDCPMWAAMGECKKNAVFMVGSLDYYGTCRKSCNAC
ncbi:probable prolyl 4-hydroxylase 12 isoform X2 [Humulus lupulus]|uniref:probable prolyl 4-hydroxylase 12 isoform X2 n=1 Tax=Humulus lupulus TaxID=3486 RepID=UPI002B40E51E|nr:probable prolyl 4-hydroxylase 12 isoform X2 [Humulus lupulus]